MPRSGALSLRPSAGLQAVRTTEPVCGGTGDELGSFIFRTTGYNSVRTLAARLKYFEAVSGGLTRYLPLTLRLRAKSTTQSYRTPVYYVDLTLRDELTLTEAVGQARQEAMLDDEAGLTIREMETVARALLRNGQFEEVDEEVPMLLEEFYPRWRKGNIRLPNRHCKRRPDHGEREHGHPR